MSDDIARLEILKARHDYGWAWFDFHAKQRTTIFNYFLLALALVVNAYATLMRSGPYYMASTVALAGAMAAFAFLCLEVRNRQLVRWGEEVLQESERDFVFSETGGKVTSSILLREKQPEGMKPESTEDWRQDGKFTLKSDGRWKYEFTIGRDTKVHTTINHGTWFPRIIVGAILFFLVLSILSFFISIGSLPAPIVKSS
jgi:hypothetical protein